MGRPLVFRLMDHCPEPAPAHELVFPDFDGTWISSDPKTRGIPRMELSVRDGRLDVRCFGSGKRGLIDWQERPAEHIFTDGVTSSTVAGFTQTQDFGFMESRLEVNLKLGVAVVCAFHRFKDGSGRRPQFWREFMAKCDVEPPRLETPSSEWRCLKDLDSGTFPESGPIDAGSLVGSWRNTQPVPTGIRTVNIRSSGPELQVSLQGTTKSGSIDWGMQSGETHVCWEEDDQLSAACLVDFELGDQRSEVQVRQNKGILAVTFFHRFLDGSGRRDWVTRELFCPQNRAAEVFP